MAKDLVKGRTAAIEEAFSRRPRPQVAKLPLPPVPTKSALMRKAIRQNSVKVSKLGDIDTGKAKEVTSTTSCLKPLKLDDDKRVAWADIIRLGTLFQGKNELILCTSRGPLDDQFMLKKVEKAVGAEEGELLEQLQHDHIIKLTRSFVDNEHLYLGLSYCRFTLREILGVHQKFREPHVEVVAKSVGTNN